MNVQAWISDYFSSSSLLFCTSFSEVGYRKFEKNYSSHRVRKKFSALEHKRPTSSVQIWNCHTCFGHLRLLFAYLLHIHFFQKCLQTRLTPTFLQYRMRIACSFARTKLEDWIIVKWIRMEIRKWYSKLNSTTKLVYVTHLRLRRLLPASELDKFLKDTASKKIRISK